MTGSVAQILSEPGRQWSRQRGADAHDLDRLVAASPYPLPDALLDLLRFSNGGEGELALPPRLFMLDKIDEILAGLNDPFLTESFAGFLFFGGNGGLERIALDCRRGTPPFPVVMIDQIGGPESAERIASDATDFVRAIGLTYPDRVDDQMATPADELQERNALVRHVVSLLAAAEYDALGLLSKGVRLSATDLSSAIEEYGGTLVPLPPEADAAIDYIRVKGTGEPAWSACVPLYTREEGRSDLTLELTLRGEARGGYRVELDGLHVQ